MYNLFLTGKIGFENTTLMKNLIERLNTSVDEFMSKREIVDDKKILKILSLFDGCEEYTIAHVLIKSIKNLTECQKDISVRFYKFFRFSTANYFLAVSSCYTKHFSFPL